MDTHSHKILFLQTFKSPYLMGYQLGMNQLNPTVKSTNVSHNFGTARKKLQVMSRRRCFLYE